MQVKVLYFGVLSETIKETGSSLQVEEGTTVGRLRDRVVERYAAVEDRLRGAMVAVNQDYAEDDRLLAEGDEVAFIPPVSGG